MASDKGDKEAIHELYDYYKKNKTNPQFIQKYYPVVSKIITKKQEHQDFLNRLNNI